MDLTKVICRQIISQYFITCRHFILTNPPQNVCHFPAYFSPYNKIRRTSVLAANQTLSCTYFDRQVPDTPHFGPLVRVEENIQPVAADDPASIEHLDRLRIVIAGNNHFGAEPIFFVGGNERVPNPDSVTVGGYSIAVFPTALFTPAIGRHAHLDNVPLSKLFPGYRRRFFSLYRHRL
jgi:hypothetical protein